MRRPPRSTRTYPLFPDTTLFRSPDRGLDDRFAREELRARFRDLRLLHRRVARGPRRAADIGEQRQDRALADAVEEVLGCRPPSACDIDIHYRPHPVVERTSLGAVARLRFARHLHAELGRPPGMETRCREVL